MPIRTHFTEEQKEEMQLAALQHLLALDEKDFVPKERTLAKLHEAVQKRFPWHIPEGNFATKIMSELEYQKPRRDAVSIQMEKYQGNKTLFYITDPGKEYMVALQAKVGHLMPPLPEEEVPAPAQADQAGHVSEYLEQKRAQEVMGSEEAIAKIIREATSPEAAAETLAALHKLAIRNRS